MDRNSTKILAGGLMSAGLFAGIVGANYATSTFGFVPVGFGQAATAGTFAAGLMLALRDGIQDTLGRRAVLIVTALGALLSLVVADASVAVASGVAFLVSELLNYAIYTPLREKTRLGDRRWATAVASSNAAGAIADTVIFVGIAFGAAAILPAMAGQLIGKSWATLSYLVIGGLTAALLRKSLRG